MSNRRRPRAQRTAERGQRCGRCRKRATHVLVAPAGPKPGQDGYEMHACDDHWPSLQAAVRSHGASVSGCLCCPSGAPGHA